MDHASQDTALVIGAGIGGLAAAMRLGAKGYRVTVLDKLDRAGGRGSSVEMEGHRFDLGPTIVTVPQLFEDLWAACGRDFRTDVDLRPLTPFYEIRWPDGSSFRASSDIEEMAAQVRAMAPDDEAGYRRFVEDSRARYAFGFEQLGRSPMHRLWDVVRVLHRFVALRADRSVHAHASRRVRDERLRMALSFHPLFIGGDPARVTSIYALVSHLETAFGVHYAMGGVQALADAMVRVIEGQGGTVRLGTDVDEITVENRRATGARLASGERIPAAVTVSNADPAHTYSGLLRGIPKRSWSPGRLKSKRWSMGLFVWYFGTKGTREMWPDMGHHTILSGPRYAGLLRDIFRRGKLAGDMSLYVHRPAVTDPSVAPEGDDSFYVLSPVPHLGHADPVDWQAMRETYRAKVAKVLEAHMPGFEDHIGPSMIYTPEEFRSRYNAPYGSGFSIEPRILQSAWFRPHNVSEEIDGLYLVGAGTHPGAGLPGVVSSAEVLAQLVPDARRAPERAASQDLLDPHLVPAE